MVSTEQPTAFHTISLSLREVMYLCLGVYVNECTFLDGWAFFIVRAMQKLSCVGGLGYRFPPWAHGLGGLHWAAPSSHPDVSNTLSCLVGHPHLSHIVPLITHQSGLRFIPGMPEVAALIFFLSFCVSGLSTWLCLRELNAPSLRLEQCLSPASSAGTSIYNIGTSQPSSITAWSFPCNAYCILFYSFFYTFSRLYNSNNVIQIIIP